MDVVKIMQIRGFRNIIGTSGKNEIFEKNSIGTVFFDQSHTVSNKRIIALTIFTRHIPNIKKWKIIIKKRVLFSKNVFPPIIHKICIELTWKKDSGLIRNLRSKILSVMCVTPNRCSTRFDV